MDDHKVDEQYRQRLIAHTAHPEVDIQPHPTPYGTALGYNPMAYDHQRKQPRYKRVPKKERPIQGPPNWSQIWHTYADTGVGQYGMPDVNEPLNPYELRYLREACVGSIGPIEFGPELDSGRFGTVWQVRGRDQWGGTRLMVCKVTRFNADIIGTADNTSAEKVVNLLMTGDTRAHKQLHFHPNIVDLVAVVDIPDPRTGFPYAVHCLFTELCNGDLMNELFVSYRDGMPERLVAQWARDITSALRFLHMNIRWAHLDVKPHNIMYCESPDGAGGPTGRTYKLRDFVSARHMPAHELMRLVLGENVSTVSPEWAAPELVRGGLEMPTHCDVYSLGASMANALMGYGAYFTAVDVSKARVLEEFRRLCGHISPGMVQLVESMLALDHRQRPNIQQIYNSPVLASPDIETFGTAVGAVDKGIGAVSPVRGAVGSDIGAVWPAAGAVGLPIGIPNIPVPRQPAPGIPAQTIGYEVAEDHRQRLIAHTAREEAIPEHEAPYGRAMGRDPQAYRDSKRGYPSTARESQRPIQGPPDWPQIWRTHADTGVERVVFMSEYEPFTREDLQYLEGVGVGSVGRLVFGEKVGAGLFGTVWQVEGHYGWGRTIPMACRAIRFAAKGDTVRESVRHLMADTCALHSIASHPNIVHTVDIVAIPDPRTGFPYAMLCVFTEWCDTNLHTMLEYSDNREGMAEQQVRHMARHIGRALRYLHQDNRTAHLDVRPATIMYKQSPDGLSGVYKLRDFAAAVQFPERESHTALPGGVGRWTNNSLHWMAPELREAIDEPTALLLLPACDVYSLGRSMARSLFGAAKYAEVGPDSGQLYAYMQALSGGARTPGIQVSPGTARLVARMLDLNPLSRPTL